jgi:hypothetical protein
MEKDYTFEKDYDPWFLTRTITVPSLSISCRAAEPSKNANQPLF